MSTIKPSREEISRNKMTDLNVPFKPAVKNSKVKPTGKNEDKDALYPDVDGRLKNVDRVTSD